MNIDDIIYTPLDCPPMPGIDFDKLDAWRVRYGTKETRMGEFWAKRFQFSVGQANYPWNLCVIYSNKNNCGIGWINNFDKEFPELSAYIDTAFGIPVSSFGSISLLPIKDDHEGTYWHRDSDRNGLRMYLQHEDPESNPLIVRPVIDRSKHLKPKHYDVVFPLNGFYPTDIVCPVLKSNQCFFINNVNAVHATSINKKGLKRYALLFGDKWDQNDSNTPTGPNEINKLTEDLVVRSAEKFKDHAVLWQAPEQLAPEAGIEPTTN